MNLRLVTVFFLLLATSFGYPEPQTENSKDGEQPPTVNANIGAFKGTIITSRAGKQIFAFRGIPYAKPPINELRFMPPVAVGKHEGVFNATQDAPLCLQNTTFSQSENCLFLNVYSTKIYTKSGDKPVKRPVVVYLHEGLYESGSGVSFLRGPQYFMDQDIVLVTLNYRLGSLGFLALGDKESPGNNGLKDQVQALKWIKQNIEAFGGDPNSVTLLGQDAILHMVSPLSLGLFHKVIAISHAPTSHWAIGFDNLELAKKQAKLLKCPEDNAANILKCLKTKPFKDYQSSVTQFDEFGKSPVQKWGPVIEKDFGQPRFLTAHPITSIQGNEFRKIPVIAGITSEEFANKAFEIAHNETLRKELNEKWDEKAPIVFMYDRKGDQSKTISKTLKHIYLEDKPIEKTNLGLLAHLLSDSLAGFGVNRAVKLLAEKNNASVYYYRFNYNGRYSNFYIPSENNNTKPYGAVTRDDLIYLFYDSKHFPLYKDNSLKETEMVVKLTSLYANFAKYGTPIPTPNDRLDNVKWEPFTIKSQKYLDIGNKLTIQEKLNEKRYAEWEKLYPLDKYARIK